MSTGPWAASIAAVVRSRSYAACAVAMTLVGAALCWAPLFDVLGYEFSLAIALAGSFAAGLVASTQFARLRDLGLTADPWRAYGALLVAAEALLVPPLALILLNALRVRQCNFAVGLAFYGLLAVPGVALGAAWGLLWGALFRRRALAVSAWAVTFAGSLGWSLWGFYSGPAIFAYGGFFGYFPGALYDEVIGVKSALVAYRALTVLEILAIVGALRALMSADGRLRPNALAGHAGRVVLAAIASLLAIGLYAAGSRIGFRQDADTIAQRLGGRRPGRRCEVIYPRALSAREASLLLDDCEFRLEQVERFFGVPPSGRLKAYFFRNARQKQDLMGAGQTFIAKPWRREVYLQIEPFPHPVLKHEIAHVVAGSFARGPFRVSARAAGLLPLPGLIEGAAVAAAWERDALTPHQWSRAMQMLKMAPPVGSLVGLGFFSNNAPMAYTLAGSFSRFLIDRHGVARFRRAYRGGDLASVYGRSVEALGREWQEYIASVPLDDRQVRAARGRFGGRAIFAKTCAHETAARLARAEGLGRDDPGAAETAYRRVLSDVPDQQTALMALFALAVRQGNGDRAQRWAERLFATRGVSAISRDIEERLGDLAWRQGRAGDARAHYGRAVAAAWDEDGLRVLAVKRGALDDETLGAALRQFLFGNDGRPETPPMAILTLSQAIAEHPSSGLLRYLLGRQIVQHGDPARALVYLEDARRLGLPGPAFDAENTRLMAVASFRTGAFDRARSEFERIAADPARPESARLDAADWRQRCEWAVRRRGDGAEEIDPSGSNARIPPPGAEE